MTLPPTTSLSLLVCREYSTAEQRSRCHMRMQPEEEEEELL